MTDKQIIIDGVNVKDCKRRIGKDNYCRYYKRPCAENNFNCIWKKYLRKEQECEELKEERNEYFELIAIRTEVLAKIANKLGMNTGIIENKELFCKIDQLKAENEKMSKGYSKLTEIVSPYMDDFTGYNEELGGFDIVLCVKELLQQLDQLKSENEHLSEKEEEAKHYLEESENSLKLSKTLTEIKEIAEKDFRHTAWEEYAKQLKQILQKINEVEND